MMVLAYIIVIFEALFLIGLYSYGIFQVIWGDLLIGLVLLTLAEVHSLRGKMSELKTKINRGVKRHDGEQWNERDAAQPGREDVC